MSCFSEMMHDTCISIPQICEVNGITYYEIWVAVGNVRWNVKHRYRNFNELHEKLVEARSVSKDLLPPKKVIGNKSPTFLEQRRYGLEKYLKEVFIYLQLSMPREFVEFLNFHLYDVIFLVQGMAQNFFLCGDIPSRRHTMSALELYAISERLKSPCPPLEYCTKQYDFSHILDFCATLRSLTIVPHTDIMPNPGRDGLFQRRALIPVGTSNIIPNQLKFELSAFKSLKTLIIREISTENIYHIGSLRDTLENIAVHQTNIDELNKILLCDDIHKNEIRLNDDTQIWNCMSTADLSANAIKSIDTSIVLLPNLKKLILDNNAITNISNLNKLSSLSVLSLCENNISDCSNWHLELGNIVELNLSQNRIDSLKGFQKLYSLIHLDISCNLITNVDEVDYISLLPCLENLRLTGNPVAGSIDYRPRVLSRFSSRLNEIILDNEKGTQQELDTALVLSALRISQKHLNAQR